MPRKSVSSRKRISTSQPTQLDIFDYLNSLPPPDPVATNMQAADEPLCGDAVVDGTLKTEAHQNRNVDAIDREVMLLIERIWFLPLKLRKVLLADFVPLYAAYRLVKTHTPAPECYRPFDFVCAQLSKLPEEKLMDMLRMRLNVLSVQVEFYNTRRSSPDRRLSRTRRSWGGRRTLQ